MSDLSHCKAVIVVFAMDGCPHCEDYTPKFEHQVRRFQEAGAPIVYYDGGQIPYGVIPVIMLDGASMDPQIAGLADQHAVEGMPTTLLLLRFGKPLKLEGDVDDREIYDMLAKAVIANR